MTCDECTAAREAPEHRLFNPLCVWCGARYFRRLKTWPAPRTMEDGNGNARPETKDERQQWRADVLRWWAQYGHDVERMKALASAETLPLAPARKGKR